MKTDLVAGLVKAQNQYGLIEILARLILFPVPQCIHLKIRYLQLLSLEGTLTVNRV